MKTIAFTGTSLTTGAFSRAWQLDVIAALRAQGKYIRNFDLGKLGAVSADGVSNITRIANLKPDFAVIEYGMNDAVTSLGISTTTFGNNITSIVSGIRSASPNTSIILMTMNPCIGAAATNAPNLNSGYYQKLRDLSTSLSTGLIDNYPNWGTPTSTQIPDNVHPTQAAVRATLVPQVVTSLAAVL